MHQCCSETFIHSIYTEGLTYTTYHAFMHVVQLTLDYSLALN